MVIFIKTQSDIVDDEKRVISSVDYYFLEEDCTRFKVSMPYQPYFYVLCKKGTDEEVTNFLMRKYMGILAKAQPILKEDLDMVNTFCFKYKKFNITNLLKKKNLI